MGNTFNNDVVTNEFSETSQYKDVKGTVVIGTAEFDYKANGLVVRGNFDYGHLSDANLISAWNKNQNHQSFSPYPRSLVGEAAIAYGGSEADVQPGLDYFRKLAEQGRLDLGELSPARLAKGEIAVAFLWDYNALAYRDEIAALHADEAAVHAQIGHGQRIARDRLDRPAEPGVRLLEPAAVQEDRAELAFDDAARVLAHP